MVISIFSLYSILQKNSLERGARKSSKKAFQSLTQPDNNVQAKLWIIQSLFLETRLCFYDQSSFISSSPRWLQPTLLFLLVLRYSFLKIVGKSYQNKYNILWNNCIIRGFLLFHVMFSWFFHISLTKQF